MMPMTICAGQSIAMPCVEQRVHWHLNHEQNERSGSRCQGGVHTERRLIRIGGVGEDGGTSTAGLLHSLAAMSLWSMSGWLSSLAFILWGEWGCFKWDFGGLEGGDVFSFRWSDEIGLCRVICVKSTMISALLRGTQEKIRMAIAVTSLHS